MSDELLPYDARVRHLAKRVKEGKVILFVGAGVSQEAGLRGGWELAESLAAEIDYTPLPGDTLGAIAEFYDREFPGELLSRLIEWYDLGASPGPSHLLIPQFAWHTVYTTNYDRLLELGYEAKGAPFHRIVYNAMLQDIPKDAVSIVKLHGCISPEHRRSKQAPLVVTDADYEDYAGREALVGKLTQSLYDGFSLLFLGYGLRDPFWNSIRRDVAEALGKHTRSYFAVLPSFSQHWEKYWLSRNVALIEARAHSFLLSLRNAGRELTR